MNEIPNFNNDIEMSFEDEADNNNNYRCENTKRKRDITYQCCYNCHFLYYKLETVNDVLYHLKKLDFTDNVNDSDYENLRCAKKVLVKEFEEYNAPKLFGVLSIVDNFFITLTVGGLQNILIKTDTLREVFLIFK